MCAIHYFLVHCFGCPCGPLLGDICLIPVTNQSGAVEAGFGGNVQGQTSSAQLQCPCCQQDGKSVLILCLTTIQQTDTGCSVCHRDMQREEHESNSRINYVLFSSSPKWNDLDIHLGGLKARVNSSCFPILKHPGWLRPAFQRAIKSPTVPGTCQGYDRLGPSEGAWLCRMFEDSTRTICSKGRGRFWQFDSG